MLLSFNFNSVRGKVNILKRLKIPMLLVLIILVTAAGLLSSYVQAQPFAFVANRGSDTVSVIDAATNTVVDTIIVGTNPHGVVVTPDETKAYVTIEGAGPTGTVSVVDTTTFTLIDTDPSTPVVVDDIPVGNRPFFGAVTPDGTRAYVSHGISSSVALIDAVLDSVIDVDPSTPASIDYIPVGSFPGMVAITPDGTRVYVASFLFDGVSIIDTATNLPVPGILTDGGATGVAITPDGTRAYVVNFEADNVSVIDIDPPSGTFHTVIATVSVGNEPTGIAIMPNGTWAYVPNNGGDTVSVIDTDPASGTFHTVIDTVSVGDGPAGAPDRPTAVAITPDGTRAYVTLVSNGAVTVIDTVTNLLIDTDPSTPATVDDITVGLSPVGLAFSSTRGGIDGVIDGATGGTVVDAKGTGAVFNAGPGVLPPGDTSVIINVFPDPGAAIPPTFAARGTLFVEITLDPLPAHQDISAPGVTLTLPLKLPTTLMPGDPMTMCKFFLDAELISCPFGFGNVDPSGTTATFTGVFRFSIFVGLAPKDEIFKNIFHW